MEYYTFIGKGKEQLGYSDVLYEIENDYIKTKYVQEAILDKYKKSINRMIVFCTEESYIFNKADIEKIATKYETDIKFNLIDTSITSEEFVSILSSTCESKEAIIDVTHCFRDLPMKLLVSVSFIEKSYGINIKHIYYARLMNEEAKLIDCMDDYRIQDVNVALNIFDKTLLMCTDLLNSVAIDDKIKNLFIRMEELNNRFEACDFIGSLKSCKTISECCSSIIKEKEIYKRIFPFIKSIKSKFDNVNSEKNEIQRYVKFIKLLIEHQKLQTAITFTDQLFRDTLVKQSSVSYSNYLYIKNKDGGIYEVSQFLMSGSGYNIKTINGVKDQNPNYISCIDKLKNYFSSEKKGIIKNYYNEIRNKINHGEKVDNEYAKKCCLAMIEIIIEIAN